jgi:uncharacterized membrane protein YdbT with pleckstrin-like domain
MASYISNNLLCDETVIARARLHWIIFAVPVTFLALGLVGISASVGAHWLTGLGLLALAIGTALGLAAGIHVATSEFAVTNLRVLAKSGFIERTSFEILLGKVEGIRVEQSVEGRLLGFGSVTVSGSGGSKDTFHGIAAPLEFRRAVLEQVRLAQRI